MPKSTLTLVVEPKHYTADEIEVYKFPLPKTERTRLTKWLEQTGGIGGEAYGLESESMPIDRLKAIIQDLI